MDPGGGYASLSLPVSLFFDETRFASSGTKGRYTITSAANLSSAVGTVVQVTGDGTTNDGYYRILSVSNNKTIKVTKNAADQSPVIGCLLYTSDAADE